MSDTPPPPPPPPPPPSGGPPPPPPPPPGGGHGQPLGAAVGEKANFGQRLVAAIIDALIIGVPFAIVNAAVDSAGGSALISLAQLAVSAWYFGTFEGTKTQTLGKQAMNIRVVDASTGLAIGNGRGVGRYFARFLSAIACLLGYFWMLWDPERQTWHDKIVGTYVVRA